MVNMFCGREEVKRKGGRGMNIPEDLVSNTVILEITCKHHDLCGYLQARIRKEKKND